MGARRRLLLRLLGRGAVHLLVAVVNYTLILITHGDAPTLGHTLESFAEMVTPAPTERICCIDGEGSLPPIEPLGAWEIHAGRTQEGFCVNTRRAWNIVNSLDGYVFYLEHDFEFTRPVDLTHLAGVLDENPQLAQMALMRDAVNAEEKAAGGLYESRPGQYEPRLTDLPFTSEFTQVPWLEHRSYFSTNPSLMTAEFMRRNPWPDYPERCEGLFGIDLLERGYRFGVWGTGEPWVRHIGQRTGTGY